MQSYKDKGERNSNYSFSYPRDRNYDQAQEQRWEPNVEKICILLDYIVWKRLNTELKNKVREQIDGLQGKQKQDRLVKW